MTIAIRDARHEETWFVVQMIRRMVTEMALYGGHAPATDEIGLRNLAGVLADEIKQNKAKYVIAESAGGDPAGIAGAELTTLGGTFAPRKILNIHAVYVFPEFRRSGIGAALVARLVEWGRSLGCERCDLNVLTRNPAKSLYEKLGFSIREAKMVRDL
jgi:GNAT superfamily N-acetyltransferase